jgi:hypothetical protein
LGLHSHLTIGGKGESNHFPLLLDVPLKAFWLEGKMSIKAGSKEEADFLGKVIISLSQIPIPDVMSADQTQAIAQVILRFLTWHGPIMLRLSGLVPALSLGGIQTVLGPRPLQ